MASMDRGKRASSASRNAARIWLPMSLTSAFGKVEGKVLLTTPPSRSTVKLPDGSLNRVEEDLLNKVRRPITRALFSSFPESDRESLNFSNLHKIRCQPARQ